MKVKPFEDQGHFTQVHNALIDAAMPMLSPNAFKILIFVVRQTRGWQREERGLSYGAIKRGSGIASDATVCKCLKELTSKHHLLTVVRSDDRWTENRYALNRRVVLDWEPEASTDPSTSKNEAEAATSKNKAASKNEARGTASKNEALTKKPASESEALIQKEESSFKKKNQSPSAPASGGRPWTDPFVKIFTEAYFQRYQLPYPISKRDKENERGRDFKAFKDARETYGDLFSLEAWTQAVKNYFASPPKPSHRIHHLIGNFDIYVRSAKDQFGNLVEEQCNDTSKKPDSFSKTASAGSTPTPQWRNNRVKLG